MSLCSLLFILYNMWDRFYPPSCYYVKAAGLEFESRSDPCQSPCTVPSIIPCWERKKLHQIKTTVGLIKSFQEKSLISSINSLTFWLPLIPWQWYHRSVKGREWEVRCISHVLIGKDPDAGKDWRQREKGAAEDEMITEHHWLIWYEFEQTLRDCERQRSLVYCSPWGHKESDMT